MRKLIVIRFISMVSQ